jgi:hypothetical protein
MARALQLAAGSRSTCNLQILTETRGSRGDLVSRQTWQNFDASGTTLGWWVAGKFRHAAEYWMGSANSIGKLVVRAKTSHHCARITETEATPAHATATCSSQHSTDLTKICVVRMAEPLVNAPGSQACRPNCSRTPRQAMPFRAWWRRITPGCGRIRRLCAPCFPVKPPRPSRLTCVDNVDTAGHCAKVHVE